MNRNGLPDWFDEAFDDDNFPDEDDMVEQHRDTVLQNLDDALQADPPSMRFVANLVAESYDGPHLLALRSFDQGLNRVASVFTRIWRTISVRELTRLLSRLERVFPDLSVKQLGRTEETLLHLAVKEGAPLRVIQVLQTDRRCILIADISGSLPLHSACENPERPLMISYLRCLVDAEHFAFRRRNNFDMIPLHCALASLMTMGQVTVRTIRVVDWLVSCHRRGLITGGRSFTPLIAALQAGYGPYPPDAIPLMDTLRNVTLPRPVLVFLERLAIRSPRSLRAVKYSNGMLNTVETALHAACRRLPKIELVEMLLRRDGDLLHTRDALGKLPLHKVCELFAEAPRSGDVAQIIDCLVRRDEGTLSHRDAFEETPVFVAIASAGNTERHPSFWRLSQLLRLIRTGGLNAVRGRSGDGCSALSLAYQHWPDAGLIDVIYNLSPSDIMFVPTRYPRSNNFEAKRRSVFLGAIEALLHVSSEEFVSPLLQATIRETIARQSPDLERASARTIAAAFGRSDMARQLETLRAHVMAHNMPIRKLLMADLLPNDGRFGSFASGLFRMNTVGRSRSFVESFTIEEHCDILASAQGEVSSMFVYLRDCVEATGYLPFTRKKRRSRR